MIAIAIACAVVLASFAAILAFCVPRRNLACVFGIHQWKQIESNATFLLHTNRRSFPIGGGEIWRCTRCGRRQLNALSGDL